MSKKNQSKSIPKSDVSSEPIWLQYGWMVLAFVSIGCWFSSINLGLTQLDDSILIGNREYLTSDFKNILQLFKMGCFHDKDVYYRPILSIYFFILNYFFGTESMMPYHLLSVLIHVINVLLVFKFLQKIILNKENAFLLTLIFAVHPAFTMAVSWIPGVNDLLLMMFAMIYFLALIKYFETSKNKYLITLILFLWIAFFTKENAVFLPFVGLIILWFKSYYSKTQIKKILWLAAATIIGWIIWYFLRQQVLKVEANFGVNYANDFLVRLKAILHYIGKAILPFNLTTIPTTEDTNFLYGIFSILLILAGVLTNKLASKKNIVFGISWFLILFMMIWAVHTHNSKNIIEYEHRLYLPFIGILFLINETIIFKNNSLATVKRFGTVALVVISLVAVNKYSKSFLNAESFWENAAQNSTKTAFSHVSFGSQLLLNGKENEAKESFKTAFKIDSTEKYVRYYLARTIYIPAQNLTLAKYYINQEIMQSPAFADLYMSMAQINYYENDFIEEEKNLEKCYSLNDKNNEAGTSLYKLNMQLHHFKKAKLTAEKLMENAIQIPIQELKLINDSIQGLDNK